MATPSNSGSDASRVRVHPERRQQPDLAKLAAALIELATEQLTTTTNDTGPGTGTGTSIVTPSPSTTDDDTNNAQKITPETPARSRRGGRAA